MTVFWRIVVAVSEEFEAMKRTEIDPHIERSSSMAGQSSFGVCESCGARKGKAAMAAHLKQCLPASIRSSPRVPVMLLRVQQAGSSVFWLQVAAAMDARLRQIDNLLRR